MRMQLLCLMIELALLVAVSGGCDTPHEPTDPPLQTPQFKPREHQWLSHQVILEFRIIDQDTRAPIEGITVEISDPFRSYLFPIRAIPPDDVGIRRLSYQEEYAQDDGLPPESRFLAGYWLDVAAPGYEPVKASLLELDRTLLVRTLISSTSSGG
jgi:hypothetical protein